MRVSTRGRYALRAIIDIAEHNTGEYIPLKEIAERQKISEKYLESILPALTKAGYLQGLRGKGGGYKLSRPPESYTVGSILKLVEGSISPVACLEYTPNTCDRMQECRTLPMWRKLNTLIDDFFEEITIGDLCKTAHDGSEYII